VTNEDIHEIVEQIERRNEEVKTRTDGKAQRAIIICLLVALIGVILLAVIAVGALAGIATDSADNDRCRAQSAADESGALDELVIAISNRDPQPQIRVAINHLRDMAARRKQVAEKGCL
jgi:hypothetical protein